MTKEHNKTLTKKEKSKNKNKKWSKNSGTQPKQNTKYTTYLSSHFLISIQTKLVSHPITHKPDSL